MQRSIYIVATVVLLFTRDAHSQALCFEGAISFPAGASPGYVIAADVDGDGHSDLVVANYAPNTISVLRNNGDLTFAPPVSYAAGTGPMAVVAVDLDGDGDKDLAVANWGSNNVSVLKNNGAGVFSSLTNYSAGSGPHSICASDLDGDSDLDLAVANEGWPSSGDVTVLRNNGNGTFSAGVNYAAGNQPYSIAAADVDGDGDQDLAGC